MNDRVKSLFEGGLGDAKVDSIVWRDDGIVVGCRPPGDLDREIFLHFKNVKSVNMELDSKHYLGKPLLWDAQLTETSDGHWRVEFECGGTPSGGITIDCEDIVEIGISEVR